MQINFIPEETNFLKGMFKKDKKQLPCLTKELFFMNLNKSLISFVKYLIQSIFSGKIMSKLLIL